MAFHSHSEYYGVIKIPGTHWLGTAHPIHLGHGIKCTKGVGISQRHRMLVRRLRVGSELVGLATSVSGSISSYAMESAYEGNGALQHKNLQGVMYSDKGGSHFFASPQKATDQCFVRPCTNLLERCLAALFSVHSMTVIF